MAIAYFSQYSQVEPGTAEQAAAAINERLGNQPPAGGLYHAEGPTDDGGWWTFNVWASAEDFTSFREQILQPVLDEVGAAPGEQRELRVQWDTSQLRGGA
jgi:hypothetical protein